MSSPGIRRVVLSGSAATVLVGVGVPAYAQTETQCEQQLTDTGDTCVEEGHGQWTLVTGSGDQGLGDGGGAGIPGWFGGLAFVMVLIGVALAVWRVSTARKLARDAGMDPDVATGVTLLDENGLSATYLASSLRSRQSPSETPTAPSPTAARLAELKKLLDGDLITQTEYDERRKAIIDSV